MCVYNFEKRQTKEKKKMMMRMMTISFSSSNYVKGIFFSPLKKIAAGKKRGGKEMKTKRKERDIHAHILKCHCKKRRRRRGN